MSSKIWVFLAVTLVSIGAGVAVAGIPQGRSIELSAITTVPTTDAPPATDAPSATDAPPDTVAETTVNATSTTASPTSDPQTASTDVEPSTTSPASTTTAATPTTRPPVDRLELSVVVVNGAALAGVAGDIADRLVELGYPNTRTLDGAETVGRSAIFAAPGLQAEAEQLAIDIGIDPSLVFPLSAAPEVLDPFEEPLLVYLGTDISLL